MPYIFISYIFYIILFFINSAYVTIPFEIQDYISNNDNEKILLKYLYKDILIKFLVGTPYQTVNLSACLGEYSTFIVDKNASGYNTSSFNSSESKTYEAINSSKSYFFRAYSEAIKSKDDFFFIRLKLRLTV